MDRDGQLVSIIVPVYDAGAFIDETIERVCCQTYADWELLLVDDCSKDDSRERIRQWCERDERIRLIAKDKNERAAMARNTGIQQARGRYIAFLDADDLWRSEKLEKELDFIKEKEAAFAFTSYEFGDEKGRGTGKIVHVPKVLTYERALSRTVIFTSTVMFDLDKVSKELIRMPDVASEDTATWWKVMRSGYPAYGLDQVLTVYRRPRKSLSSNKSTAVKRIWDLYRKEEKLSLGYSFWNLVRWAIRATARRI